MMLILAATSVVPAIEAHLPVQLCAFIAVCRRLQHMIAVASLLYLLLVYVIIMVHTLLLYV